MECPKPNKGGKGRGKGRNYKAPPKSEELKSEMFGPNLKPGAPVVVPGGNGDIAGLAELGDDAGGFIARVLKKFDTAE